MITVKVTVGEDSTEAVLHQFETLTAKAAKSAANILAPAAPEVSILHMEIIEGVTNIYGAYTVFNKDGEITARKG